MKTLHHSDIKFLVVHCSGSRCDRPFTVEGLIATGMARFGQPSYHYYVRRNGAVVAILPESVQGVHAVRFNHCSLAICYEGGLNALGEPSDTRTGTSRFSISSPCISIRLYIRLFVHSSKSFVHSSLETFSAEIFGRFNIYSYLCTAN